MKRVFSFLSLLILIIYSFALPKLVKASTYYVSTTGNDTNSGTTTSPYKTITKGISVLLPGDTLYVRGGTYPTFSVVNKSGSSSSPITISSFPNENPIISGGIGIRLENTNYVTVHGFEVTGAGGAGVSRKGGVVITNGANNTVEYCNIHDNLTDSPNGIKIEGSSNNHILHNIVHNNGGLDGGVGIRLIGYFPSPATSSNEIGWNTVYNQTLAGANADGIGLIDNVSNTNIHDNVVYGNGDDGIDTWNTSGNLITGNTSYNQLGPGDGNGFKMGGSTTGGNNVIKNNLAYGNKYNGFDSNGSGANYYENNVAHDNGKWGFQDSWRNTGDTRSSSLVNNNSYNNISANYIISSYTTLFTGNTETISSPVPSAVPTPTPKPWTTLELDFSTWLSHYLQSATGFTNGDYNENGFVDGIDYVLWANKYGI